MKFVAVVLAMAAFLSAPAHADVPASWSVAEDTVFWLPGQMGNGQGCLLRPALVDWTSCQLPPAALLESQSSAAVRLQAR